MESNGDRMKWTIKPIRMAVISVGLCAIELFAVMHKLQQRKTDFFSRIYSLFFSSDRLSTPKHDDQGNLGFMYFNVLLFCRIQIARKNQ